MAAVIAKATGVSPELVVGGRGEFTVWVDDVKVAEKSRRGFPADDAVIRAVEERLGAR